MSIRETLRTIAATGRGKHDAAETPPAAGGPRRWIGAGLALVIAAVLLGGVVAAVARSDGPGLSGSVAAEPSPTVSFWPPGYSRWDDTTAYDLSSGQCEFWDEEFDDPATCHEVAVYTTTGCRSMLVELGLFLSGMQREVLTERLEQVGQRDEYASVEFEADPDYDARVTGMSCAPF